MADGVPFPDDLPDEATFWRAARAEVPGLARADLARVVAGSHRITAALAKARLGTILIDELVFRSKGLFQGFVLFSVRLTHTVTLTHPYERRWTWEGALGGGPGGPHAPRFLRLTGSPAGVMELFARGRPDFAHADARTMASIVDAALDGSDGVSDLAVRSDWAGLLEKGAANLFRRDRAFELTLVDAASKKLASSVRDPVLEDRGTEAVLTFDRAVVASGSNFGEFPIELRRHRVVVDKASFGIVASFTVLGLLSAKAEMARIGGRPFVVDGTSIVATVQDDDAWSTR